MQFQFGARHRKADHIVAILLELDIIFAIPMIFHHLGLIRSPVATSVQNNPPREKSHNLRGRLWGRTGLRLLGGWKTKQGHTGRGKLCPRTCVTFNTPGLVLMPCSLVRECRQRGGRALQ